MASGICLPVAWFYGFTVHELINDLEGTSPGKKILLSIKDEKRGWQALKFTRKRTNSYELIMVFCYAQRPSQVSAL